jgi:hypothetical protein
MIGLVITEHPIVGYNGGMRLMELIPMRYWKNIMNNPLKLQACKKQRSLLHYSI